jgi:MoaA/NifB/PqqE/SkfB family radical SAM enzyme
MVVSQDNKNDVYETGKFVHSLGIESFSVAHAVPSNSGGKTHLDNGLTKEEMISCLESLDRIREETRNHFFFC